MFRVGIIGCGQIGCGVSDSHMRAYLDRHYDDIRLVALCDKDKEKTDKFSDFCDAIELTTDNYLDMVRKSQPDIVSVCTPPETHCQIVCDIAPYVKAIYCEKPIALTLEDADKMIRICHENNVILQINHQRSFMIPKFRFSRGIINTGTHMFALLRQLFGKVSLEYGINEHPNLIRIGDTVCEIEEVDTEEPIFEFDCTHNKERMILAGVDHLVDCLEGDNQSICSGEKGREALRLALLYGRMKNGEL